ncbi:hypothetical protein K503DRAFT_777877 [Rhizopogon vinicolor AM-OR11-026]|uniref:Uncharacterized protein n=1 Tax=Rhizopogon vinicolor AM-OR11-026 TaxID=1314800 RepID=A0A1B7MEL2_9AGAM|nr:hypothetical protein K503DRAFT_777877 [Rhizopogon vinicolor AM-OR11-026]
MLPGTPGTPGPTVPQCARHYSATDPECQAPQCQQTLQTPQNAHPSIMQFTFSGDMSRYTN